MKDSHNKQLAVDILSPILSNPSLLASISQCFHTCLYRVGFSKIEFSTFKQNCAPLGDLKGLIWSNIDSWVWDTFCISLHHVWLYSTLFVFHTFHYYHGSWQSHIFIIRKETFWWHISKTCLVFWKNTWKVFF